MGKKNTFTFLIYFFIFHTQLFSNAIVNPKKVLEQSKTLFKNGNYKEFISKILKLNPRKDLELHEDIKQAYELMAIAYWRINKPKQAKQAIIDLLLIDNQASLEAFSTPPDLLKIFNDEKHKIETKKLSIIKNKTIQLIDQKNKNIYYNFLPFGLNYYSTNNNIKAITQLSLQTSFLAINIGSFWIKKHYEDKFYKSYIKKNEYHKAFKNAQIIQLSAIAAFFASYLFSTIDSLVTYYN